MYLNLKKDFKVYFRMDYLNSTILSHLRMDLIESYTDFDYHFAKMDFVLLLSSHTVANFNFHFAKTDFLVSKKDFRIVNFLTLKTDCFGDYMNLNKNHFLSN